MAVLSDHSKQAGHGFSQVTDVQTCIQDPIAVIGMACRLPGDSNSPRALWEFLESGGIASNTVPLNRYSVKTHYVGSDKQNTMRSPGGMYLEKIDPQDFDAPFFNISRQDAITMDPNQRQLLEVVFEGLENAGITLESLDGAPVGCFVGSYAVDYADVHARDPEDRPPGIAVGIGRAILANRISHFLNIKGPSATIDTACSASLQGVDIAIRYLQTREITGAIVAASNIILSPEHSMDSGGLMSAHSPSGRCHTFDKNADGYIKSEAVNAVILKRLDDAIRDGDSVRAIIRGIATNSDGRTPGIVSPSSEAQASAIRSAYANAGITDYSITSYLECHGTGTLAGDPIEVAGAASVFTPTRSKESPLRIGSIKSNIGHSEPAAGISGLMKTVLSIEKGMIPGNPTFNSPNPKIDFENLRLFPSKAMTAWPDVPYRRASVNCFGYGGSNAHVVVDEFASYVGRSPNTHISSYIASEDDIFAEGDNASRPVTLVFSANDEKALKAYCNALSDHLVNPNVRINLFDLAYTLSERRTRHFHRAYIVSQDPTDLDQNKLFFGKKSRGVPKVGFVFTGQGAQWSQMGKELVNLFPSARGLLKRLDAVLQALPDPPSWSLLSELVEPRKPQHLRQPEFSQPLVTALQLVLLQVLESWGIKAQSVVGHSSGEIAAAVAAGHLTEEEAIKIAFYRGRAAVLRESKESLGMLAVGLGPEKIEDYVGDLASLAQVGCVNSPKSVTLSGNVVALETVKARLDTDKHFSRLLQVDMAYHSGFMVDIAACYEDLLLENCSSKHESLNIGNTIMYSSVSGQKLDQACDAAYWKSNMISPVSFSKAVEEMLSADESPDFLIEIGPSGALAGPIKQILDELPGARQAGQVQYCASFARGSEAIEALFGVAGRLFVSGGDINLSQVNTDENDSSGTKPRLIVDLPNYAWNHSTKYWHESDSSKDWRFRKFPHHDLLGGKVLGTSWESPSFRKTLRMKDQPWLRDHRMGSDFLLPAAGFISMAVEAIYQSRSILDPDIDVSSADELCYRLRNVKFDKALVLEEDADAKVMLNLTPQAGPKDTWYEFKVSSSREGLWTEHCTGIIRLEKSPTEVASAEQLAPLKHPKLAPSWYKAFNGIGYGFGPEFQKQIAVEAVAGNPTCRSHISLTEPPSIYPQSPYPMHPVCMDGCFQTFTPTLWLGDRSAVDSVMVPAIIDDLILNKVVRRPEYGVAIATSKYSGRGRIEEKRNWYSNTSVYDPNTGNLLLKVSGLRYHKLDTGMEIGADHTFARSMWKPDITFLSPGQLPNIGFEESLSTLQQVVDLIVHKKSTLKVMEVDLGRADISSVWFEDTDAGSRPPRTSYSAYIFATADPNTMLAAKDTFGEHRSSKFSLLDLASVDFIPDEESFDLIILKGDSLSEPLLKVILQNFRRLLADNGHAILVEHSTVATDSGSGSEDDAVVVSGPGTLDTVRVLAIADEANFYPNTKVPCEPLTSIHLLVAKPMVAATVTDPREVVIISLAERKPVSPDLRTGLENAGWNVSEPPHPINDIKPKSTILIQDELFAPVLATVSSAQWEALQHLVSQSCKILWLTQGSQMEVTNPDVALAHGMLRTIRQEDPSLRLVTLDVQASDSSATTSAVVNILERLHNLSAHTLTENEFVERNGVIFVNRVVPDKPVNQVRQDESRGGAQPIMKSLRDVEGVANLRAERLGNLDALQYAEVHQVPVPDGFVEVELVASGLNFKDIIVAQGVVPENEHELGLEGAGVVIRVGSNSGEFKVGDRVAMVIRPTFANKIQCPVQYTHRIPDWLSFEDAATIPLVYLTSIYCLFNTGNLQRGQSILIHSAAGGIGIACIYLARYIGAEIYVTVGNEDKRKFLNESFGIPEDRMFSSRTTDFARGILDATHGKGVDLIVNALVGELLDESWRIVADGGVMVEIGKKDIVERHSLSMEPFDRNCSFRPVDFSHKQISPSVVASLMTHCFKLLEGGHIKPIKPITRIGFDSIPAAFAYMRNGRHIGKVIITDGEAGITSKVPIRPPMRALSRCLRPDVAYLIVGGLKGLCGSLAVHLAVHGAKYVISMSRSGITDERSQGIVNDCNSFGCEVQEATADVSRAEDVERVFKQAIRPIAGIVQGAMVLRDKPFETMTIDDFRTTISNKVQGTWNLHNSSIAHKSPISFFTLLSSISGVLGQKGQANYAAANVFMDAFASFRHSRGLPANSLDLGVIEDVGYVAEQGGMQQHFDDRLWTGINETMLRRIFNYSVFQQMQPINPDSVTQLITGIAVPQPDDSDLSRDARFGALFMNDSAGTQTTGAKAGDQNAKAVQAFLLLHRSKASKESLMAAGVEVLNRQFVKSLRLTEPMEPARSLSAYGLDSLSAVEVRNWVRRELAAELTTLDITNASSLYGLCERVIAKMPVVE